MKRKQRLKGWEGMSEIVDQEEQCGKPYNSYGLDVGKDNWETYCILAVVYGLPRIISVFVSPLV